VKSAQVLSFLMITGGFLFLRVTLLKIGRLRSMAGIVFLYTATAIPLFVFLSSSTGNDTPMFLSAMATLYLSVLLFWDEESAGREYWLSRSMISVLLVLFIVAGVLTKYNGLLSCAIPFIVIVIRYSAGHISRRFILATLVVISSLVLTAPLYYARYYQEEGKMIPIDMEWKFPELLERKREQRDKDPWGYLFNIIRFPRKEFWFNRIADKGSFTHVIWFRTWKLEEKHGPQSELSQSFSDIYIMTFFVLLTCGTLSFVIFYPRRDPAWNALGLVLFLISLMYCLAILKFGYSYPQWEWDWRAFKPKYIAPAFLWISFSVSMLIHDAFVKSSRPAVVDRWLQAGVYILVAGFMGVNFLLPVF
jgi:hypothetical protein